LTQPIIQDEESEEENFEKEVEEMIECTEFIGNLINKKSKGKHPQSQTNDKRSTNYQYLLQQEEILSENLNTNFLKRKRNLEIAKLHNSDYSEEKVITADDKKCEEDELNNLFDLDWRKQN
jgi:hypothetical protein